MIERSQANRDDELRKGHGAEPGITGIHAHQLSERRRASQTGITLNMNFTYEGQLAFKGSELN
jgi:hypothetical protein